MPPALSLAPNGTGWLEGDQILHEGDGELFLYTGGAWVDEGVSILGPEGPEGLQGSPGTPGTHGDKGDDGIHGTHGTHGDDGPEGPVGPVGPAGTAVTVKAVVPTVSALPTHAEEGEVHYVADVGDLYIHEHLAGDPDNGAWHDMGHIAGPQGVPGDQGIQGDPGIHGTHGDHGDPGVRGSVWTLFDGGAIPAPPSGGWIKGDILVHTEEAKRGNYSIWNGHSWSPSAAASILGPQGPAGGKGDRGIHGSPGANGHKGDTGSQGPRGPQGARGAVDFATADHRYLRLDASNDPVTGAIEIKSPVGEGTPRYAAGVIGPNLHLSDSRKHPQSGGAITFGAFNQGANQAFAGIKGHIEDAAGQTRGWLGHYIRIHSTDPEMTLYEKVDSNGYRYFRKGAEISGYSDHPHAGSDKYAAQIRNIHMTDVNPGSFIGQKDGDVWIRYSWT